MNFQYSTSTQNDLYIPSHILLQWHITERCNLRCAHCYQGNYSGKELTFEHLLGILEQFKKMLFHWRAQGKGRPIKGHITVTGGEPFVRKDFFDLLEVFHQNKELFSFAILSNGTFIDAKNSKRLRELNPAFMQVSIEGTQATHDDIRGKGSYEKTISAIRLLVKAKIRTLISFTAHRRNYKEFPDVARLGRRLKVSRVWADRLIPQGSGENLEEMVLTPEETLEFFKLMEAEEKKASRTLFGKTEIVMNRALQFLVAGGKPYYCTAGDTLLTVQPNGDLYPCRRMPIKVGNLLETHLLDLYYSSELFNTLRDKSKISTGCKNCFYAKLCRGGLKCLSYAISSDSFRTDPGCWHSQRLTPYG